MDSEQINSILYSDRFSKLYYRGTFSCNQLPVVERYPSGYIVNTDTSDGIGEHWLGFFFDEAKHGEFFDSYDNELSFYDERFKTFLEKYSMSWNCNQKRLQGPFSTTCGQHCVYYMLLRCRGISLSKIVSNFSNNYNGNDRFVTHFLAKYYNVFTPTHDVSFYQDTVVYKYMK